MDQYPWKSLQKVRANVNNLGSSKKVSLAMKAQGNKPKNQEIRKMLEEADTDGINDNLINL